MRIALALLLLLAAPATAPAQTFELMQLFQMMALTNSAQASAQPQAAQPQAPQAQAAAPAQTVSTLTAQPTIAGNGYSVTNQVTYAKTANGLLVVLSPATLTGGGPLAGHQQGLTMEIPDFIIRQLF